MVFVKCCCRFVVVLSWLMLFGPLSMMSAKLHPIKCSRSLNRDIALVDRSEVEEVGFDISVRDRTTYALKLFENFRYVLYLLLRWKALGHVVLLLRGTIKRNYGDVIAAQKGRKLILTLQGFHVIQHKRSPNLHLTQKHCQRHNGPEGWVHITRSQFTNLKHITRAG